MLSLAAGGSRTSVLVLMDVEFHGTENGPENETADHDRGHRGRRFQPGDDFVQVVKRPAHREPRGSQGTVAISLARLPDPFSRAIPNAGETMARRRPPGNGDVCHKLVSPQLPRLWGKKQETSLIQHEESPRGRQTGREIPLQEIVRGSQISHRSQTRDPTAPTDYYVMRFHPSKSPRFRCSSPRSTVCHSVR